MESYNHLYGFSHIQLRACTFLVEEAKDMVERCHAFGPLSWQDYMKVRTVDYKGDEVNAAQQTSWANVAPALPDEVGNVPLRDVVSKGCLHYVENFEQYLLPEADQVRVKPPRVMVPLCRGLLNKGNCGLTPKSNIHHVKGRPLFNGLFGVPKEETVNGVSVHRLIMNLIPFKPHLPSDARRY